MSRNGGIPWTPSLPAVTEPGNAPPRNTGVWCNRLNRIEGQVRGIRGMLEKDAYCPDILAQAAAANAALNAFSRELLAQHIRTCVARDIREGKDEIIDELMDTLRRLMR